jgi:nicotinamidase-related amidase
MYLELSNVSGVTRSKLSVYDPGKNDLVLQLRKAEVSQVVLAGMAAANPRIESHSRELIEQGFEVVVVCDAMGAPRLPDDGGYLAAIINYGYLAHASSWTAERTLAE